MFKFYGFKNIIKLQCSFLNQTINESMLNDDFNIVHILHVLF